MDIFNITTQEILDRISRHCPQALSTYLHCINRANECGEFTFSRSMIVNDMSDTYTKFRNNLKHLALENVLEWHQTAKGLRIILADLYDEE